MSAPRTHEADGQQALLAAHDIRLSYPAPRGSAPREVLAGVSLAMAAGESVALVGESGSGKSSLARVLLQLVWPSGGEVFLRGQSLTALWRRQVQMVFQNAAGSLDGRLSVGANIALPLEIYGEGTQAQRAERTAGLLAEVGLAPELAARMPHELSGGQRQRVAIARALALDPQLLVADEPTSALDVTLKGQILRLFLALQARRNLALLFVSHDLGAVAALCTRTLVMQHGHIVEQGSTRALLGAPKHPYTQALIRAVPRLAVPKARPARSELTSE